MEFSFKTNSWHGRLHDKTYYGALPENFCPYARRTIITCLFLPITWITYFMEERQSNLSRFSLALAIYLFAGLLEVAGLLFYYDFLIGKGDPNIFLLPVWSWFAAIPTALFFLASCFAAMAGIVWIYTLIADYFENRSWQKMIAPPTDSKVDNVFISYIKMQKAKICPKINWKDED